MVEKMSFSHRLNTQLTTLTNRFKQRALPALGEFFDSDVEATQRSRVRVSKMAMYYLISIGTALLLTGALVAAVGHSPWGIVSDLYRGSVSTPGAFGRTLDNTYPILFVALGTMIAVRAGMFNIGQSGQLVIGATAAGFVALKVSGPGPLVLVLALLASIVGGALWAGISALLYAWRRINVVISTLLLVYVATQILSYVVSNRSLLQEPAPPGGAAGGLPQSSLVPMDVRLPHPGAYPSFGFSSALVIGLVVVGVAFVALKQTSWGVKLRMLGANSVAARRFGVRVVAMGIAALMISGALAGFAGGAMLTGDVYRVQAGFANTYGNDGLLAALVCNDRVGALIPVALAFGIIRTGGDFFLSTGVPAYLAQVLQGLLVLAAVFPPVYLDRRLWLQRLKAARVGAFRSTVPA